MKMPAIAVIADAHFHDAESDYGCSGVSVEGRQLTLRSWADTRSSSRVFNESKVALLTALQQIETAGIKHVVLLGDYSDDGQIEAIERLVDLLREHRDRFDTQFFAITGNHDAFGPAGKHQSTRFAGATGDTTLVTSDPKVAATEPESAILTRNMYCEGVGAGISKMSEFGLFRQASYLHWETPFGSSDLLDDRQYVARSADGQRAHKLVDASYLVEPVEGLWLLMIDANVFEPRNGQWRPTQKKAFLDCSDAGWNSVLRNRAHLMDWINNVCARAGKADRKLIAFSHYPIIDPFADADDNAFKLFGECEMLRRKPADKVARTLLDYGLRLHFSGHMHVSGFSQRSDDAHDIKDSHVPSLVTFPPGYQVVHSHEEHHRINHHHLFDMPLDPLMMAFYCEDNASADDIDRHVLAASNYGEFLYHRMHTRAIHHYLKKEWPLPVAQAVLNTTTCDLVILMLSGGSTLTAQCRTGVVFAGVASLLESTASDYGLSVDDLAQCSMTRLVADWYCLRHAGYLAGQFIGSNKLNIYSYLAESFGDLSPRDTTLHRSFFAVFLGMLKSSLDKIGRQEEGLPEKSERLT